MSLCRNAGAFLFVVLCNIMITFVEFPTTCLLYVTILQGGDILENSDYITNLQFIKDSFGCSAEKKDKKISLIVTEAIKLINKGQLTF